MEENIQDCEDAVADIMRSRESIEIEQCWRSFRGDNLVPLRSSVSAKGIPPLLLPRIGIFVVETSKSGKVAKYRLAGTRYRQITGTEITGTSFDEHVVGGDVKDRAELVHQVMAHPAGVWWVSEVSFGEDFSCYYRSTLLPLRSANNMVDHCLDFVEFDIPIAYQGQRGMLSSKLFKYQWIDIGAGAPS